MLADSASASGRHAQAAAFFKEAAMSSDGLGEPEPERDFRIRQSEELVRAGQVEAGSRIARHLLEGGSLAARQRQAVLTVLGDEALLARRPEQAEQNYRKALEIADGPWLRARCAAALLELGKALEAASLLAPVVRQNEGTRLDDRLYAESLARSGEHGAAALMPLTPLTGAPDAGHLARRAGRLAMEENLQAAIDAAQKLANDGQAVALFDAAAVAESAGRSDLSALWIRSALARGLDPVLLRVDPDLSRVKTPLPAPSH